LPAKTAEKEKIFFIRDLGKNTPKKGTYGA